MSGAALSQLLPDSSVAASRGTGVGRRSSVPGAGRSWRTCLELTAAKFLDVSAG
ncbi:hypothetical protein ACFWM5_26640 [Streptomyces bobili]|uniref:hypothetical protein n=1 Tax=Streptomyces bobili TaxID=67280 RepID=UPI00366671F4